MTILVPDHSAIDGELCVRWRNSCSIPTNLMYDLASSRATLNHLIHSKVMEDHLVVAMELFQEGKVIVELHF